jgi:peptide/nickel transport system substrate-binding protein
VPRRTSALLLGAAVLPLLGAGPALRYAEDRGPAVVNPLFSTTMAEVRVNELVFESLFADDAELRSVPRLADRIETSADHKSATVTIRPGVTWHDGQPFRAADVVFTIEAMRDPRTASPEAGRVAFIDTVDAPDDRTVVLTFRRPELAPEDRLHFKLLPAHAFGGDPAVDRSHTFRLHPVGTGPYQLVGFQEDGSIQLGRYAGYRKPPTVPEVVLREVTDKAYQTKLLLYESLEALVRVLPRHLATLEADRKTALYPYQTNSWWYLGMDQADPVLSRPEVRQALSAMVDVDNLLAPIGTGSRISGPYVPSSPFYNHDVPLQDVDSDRAAALLRQAGFVQDSRGWSDAQGRPLRLRLAAQANTEVAQDLVINLQSQFSRNGVIVDPEFLGPAEWKKRIWTDRDFDLVLSTWSFDRNEDIREQFHSRGTRNLLRYGDREVDRLLDAAREATDPIVKKAQVRKVHALIAEDAPMVFLFTLDSWAAMSTRVGNVTVHPFSFFNWIGTWTM